MGEAFCGRESFVVDFCSELFSPSLNCQSAVAESRLLLKGRKRSDLICHDSYQGLHWLINVFLLMAPWFQHSVTVAIRWQKNELPQSVRLHHYKSRALDELLIFALPSHISSKQTTVVGSANRSCITSEQKGSDQQTVLRIPHVQPLTNWVESSMCQNHFGWFECICSVQFKDLQPLTVQYILYLCKWMCQHS